MSLARMFVCKVHLPTCQVHVPVLATLMMDFLDETVEHGHVNLSCITERTSVCKFGNYLACMWFVALAVIIDSQGAKGKCAIMCFLKI